MGFTLNILEDKLPQSSSRFRKEVFVSELDNQDAIDEAKDIITGFDIVEDNPNWSCQDFVIEVLEELDEAGLLQQDTYDEARTTLEEDYNE
jgi:hypothetical protein